MRRIRFGRSDAGAGTGGVPPTEIVARPWLIEPAKSAGRQAARIVGTGMADESALAAPVLAAPETRLLLVAGVLLDLMVGEALRRSGRTPPCPADGVTWVLPPVPLSTGMRCIHAPSTSIGAAVLWTSGVADLALPLPGDLPRLLDGDRPVADAVTAVQRLRLRLAGWAEPAYLLMEIDGRIRSVLASLASIVVERVHEPLYDRLKLDPLDPLRHVANRLIIDFAVAAMLTTGRLSPLGPGDLRRLVWTGPDWMLASDAMGLPRSVGEVSRV